MGIRSTRNIDRETAIQRILSMDTLIINKDYRQIEVETCEGDCDFANLVDNTEPLNANEES